MLFFLPVCTWAYVPTPQQSRHGFAVLHQENSMTQEVANKKKISYVLI
jgi:hypothetical protein